MLVSRWVPPHLMTRRVWGMSLLGIVSVELSTARIHRAKKDTLRTWSAAFDIAESFVSFCYVYFILYLCIFVIFRVVGFAYE